MRVAMVSEHASPLAVLGGQDAGGQNVHVAELSTALAARGHEVTVYTRRDAGDLPDSRMLAPGVEVVHVPAGPPTAVPKDDLLPFMPAMASWLAQEWARTRPDVVHAHFWMSALATRDALRALASAGAGPTVHPAPAGVVTFHALGVVKRRHQGAQDTSPPQRPEIEAKLVHDLSAVIATCRDEVRELLALGADPQRLHVVPCGVDLSRFNPVGPRYAPWSSGARRLLCLGRLVERKGVETAIDALTLLPDAELVVAGGPAVEGLDDDPDVQRLRAHARRVGAGDRVRFVGRVTPDDAAALLRGAEVLVAVPWYEPFGIVPLESMACGTPVVATAVGGMLDTVVPGVTGAHVPPRAPEQVAAAVQRLTGPALGEIGRAGVEHVGARFSWSQVAAQTEAVYEQVVGPASPVREPVATGRRAPGPTQEEEP